MHWVSVPWWEAWVYAFAGALGLDLLRWWRRKREKQRAPLFMDLRGAAEWAKENPGKLAQYPHGQVRWGKPE